MLPQDETARREPGWQLLAKSVAGIAVTLVFFILIFGVFVHLIDGGGSWWFTGHHVAQEGWYEAVRNSVASVALSVAGGAAYLAYRRQRTADLTQYTNAEAKQIAAKAQQTSADAYKLNLDQYNLALLRRDDDQVRELRARFSGAAEHLAHTSPAVRIAGVYAMAALAEDWQVLDRSTEVQVCIDVLCGYLRLPYSPEHGNADRSKVVVTSSRSADDPGAVAANTGSQTTYEEHFEYRQNDKVVRQTIVRAIRLHLIDAATSSWSPYDFNFTGAHFDDANFDGATFGGRFTWFDGATFSGNQNSFSNVTFRGNRTWFRGAKFTGNSTWFDGAIFSGEHTGFDGATFSGEQTSFSKATFGKQTSFSKATFSSETTLFDGATFSGEQTSFSKATFSGDLTSFIEPLAWNCVRFDWDSDPTGANMPACIRPRVWPPEVGDNHSPVVIALSDIPQPYVGLPRVPEKTPEVGVDLTAGSATE